METEFDIKDPAETVLLKAKERFNYVNWNRGVPAHYQSPGCYLSEVKGLVTTSIRFVDSVSHSNGDLTLVTNNKFYIRFSNR